MPKKMLSKLPRSALVETAKKAGMDASLAHSKQELVEALVQTSTLRENPMQVVRRRIYDLVQSNWAELEDLLDPQCAECHRQHQQLCSDIRAIGDYLANMDLYNYEE